MKYILKWILFAILIYAFFFLSNLIIEGGSKDLTNLIYRSLMLSWPCLFFFIFTSRYIQKKQIIYKEFYSFSFIFYIIQSLIFYKSNIVNNLNKNYILSNIEAIFLTFTIILIVVGIVKYKIKK